MGESIMHVVREAELLKELCRPHQQLSQQFDRLRSLGQYVEELSIIVVCGPDSVGKSTVLRAISGFQSPDATFLTELRIRRARTKQVQATARCVGGSKEIVVDEKACMAQIYDKAKDFVCDRDGANLCVTIAGPDYPNLMLVDVPHTMRVAAGQAPMRQNDIHKRISTYLNDHRTTILVVLQAGLPAEWEETLAHATQAVEGTKRTLGIITKVDLLEPTSRPYSSAISLARNENTQTAGLKLGLGWHVLSCGNTKEGLWTEATEKDYFASPAWENVPDTNKGVPALRSKLSGILLSVMKRRLPALSEEVRTKLEIQRGKMQNIGERLPDTETGRRRSFQQLASQFHDTSCSALHGSYKESFFFPRGPRGNTDKERQKKRELHWGISNLNEAFRTVMTQRAARWVIDDPGMGWCPTQQTDRYRDQEQEQWLDMFKEEGPEPITLSGLAASLSDCSGEGLVFDLFREQSQKWHSIAKRYVEVAFAVARGFVMEAVGSIFGNYCNLEGSIEKEFVKPFLSAVIAELIGALDELISPYRDGSMTQLDYCRRYDTTCRNQQIAEQVRELLDATQPAGSLWKSHDVFQAILEAPQPLSDRLDFADATSMMMEYYSESLAAFTNSIITKVDSRLLSKIPGILEPMTDPNLDVCALHRLAREPEDKALQRKCVQKEICILEGALRVCEDNKLSN